MRLRPDTKHLLLLMLLCGTALFSSAKSDSVKQYKDFGNTIILANSYFYFPGNYSNGRFRFIVPYIDYGDQFSAYYERKIYKNWRIGVGYTTWNVVPKLLRNTYVSRILVFGASGFSDSGALEYRRKYKMYDLYTAYKYDHLKKHKITAGIGASYAWGINSYVDSVIWADPWGTETYTYTHEENHHYYGAIATLRYDYVLFKNRVNVGADFKYRKYFSLYTSQLDYGIHVAINF